jgi:phage I-like protein
MQIKAGIPFQMLQPHPASIQKNCLRSLCGHMGLKQSGSIDDLVQRLKNKVDTLKLAKPAHATEESLATRTASETREQASEAQTALENTKYVTTLEVGHIHDAMTCH